MPTADYELSGVHTADTRSLKDRLESFSRNVGGNITGAGSRVHPGRRVTQLTSAQQGPVEISASPTPVSRMTLAQRAPAFDRRSSMLEQPPLFMRLIAAYKALVDGKVPTNEQLEDMMDAVAKAKNIRGVSGDGMECLRALDGLLQTVKKIVRERNQDEAIQRFFYHLRLGRDLSPRKELELFQKPLRLLKDGARVEYGSEIQRLDETLNELFQELTSAAREEGIPVEEPGKAFAEVSGRVRGDVKGYLKGARKWEAEEEEEGEEQAEEYGGEEEEEEEQEVPLRSSRRKGATAGRQAYIFFFFSVLEEKASEKKPKIHAQAKVKAHPERKKTVEAPQPSKSKSKQMVPGAETSPSSTMSGPAAMDAPRRPQAKASQKRSGYKTEGRQKEAKLAPSEAPGEWGEFPIKQQESLPYEMQTEAMVEEGVEPIGIGIETMTSGPAEVGVVSIEFGGSGGASREGYGCGRAAEGDAATEEFSMGQIPGTIAVKNVEPRDEWGKVEFKKEWGEVGFQKEWGEEEGGEFPKEWGEEEGGEAGEVEKEWGEEEGGEAGEVEKEWGGEERGVAQEVEEYEQREDEESLTASTTTSTISSAARSIDRQLEGKRQAAESKKAPHLTKTAERKTKTIEHTSTAKGKEVARTGTEGKSFLGKMGTVAHRKLLPMTGPENDEVDVDAIADQFVKIMRRLQQPEMMETRDAISGLISMVSGFDRRAVPWDPHMDVAMRELQLIVSRFAKNRPVEPLLAAAKSLSSKLSENEELRMLWNDAYELLSRCIAPDKRFVMSRDIHRRTRTLAHRIRKHVVQEGFGPYETDLKTILREVDGLVKDLTSDTLSKRLGEDVIRMKNALFFDSAGRPTFKTPLVMDITHVIIPMLWEDLKYIPIPRVEHRSRDWHIVVENIILTTENIVPNLMELKVKNSFLIGLRPEVGTAMDHSFTLNFFQIQADEKDWLPADDGLGFANLKIGGEGITVKTKIGLDFESSRTTIFPQKVVVSVENLDLQIVYSRNDALYRMMHTAIVAILRRELAALVGKQVLQTIAIVDEKITPMKMKYVEGLKARGGMVSGQSGLQKTSKFIEDMARSDVAKTLVDKMGSVAKELMAGAS
ncbi:hypothetical protein BC829DRAFT_476181 [Chytridium lagenaria]|nr:hypothetical protein BC829DRAFT_476181 [Chytridium lagenaria]